jgi:hypothetical protein
MNTKQKKHMNTIQYIPSDSQNEMATISTLNSLPTLYGRQRRPPSYLTNNYYHGELRTKVPLKNSEGLRNFFLLNKTFLPKIHLEITLSLLFEKIDK